MSDVVRHVQNVHLSSYSTYSSAFMNMSVSSSILLGAYLLINRDNALLHECRRMCLHRVDS